MINGFKKFLLLTFFSLIFSLSCAYAQDRPIEKTDKQVKVLEEQMAVFKGDYNKLLKRKAPQKKIDALVSKMESLQEKINILSRNLSQQENERPPALTQEQQQRHAEIAAEIKELGRQSADLRRALFLLEEKIDSLVNNKASEGEIKQLDGDANVLRQEILRIEHLQLELDKSIKK